MRRRRTSKRRLSTSVFRPLVFSRSYCRSNKVLQLRLRRKSNLHWSIGSQTTSHNLPHWALNLESYSKGHPSLSSMAIRTSLACSQSTSRPKRCRASRPFQTWKGSEKMLRCKSSLTRWGWRYMTSAAFYFNRAGTMEKRTLITQVPTAPSIDATSRSTTIRPFISPIAVQPIYLWAPQGPSWCPHLLRTTSNPINRKSPWTKTVMIIRSPATYPSLDAPAKVRRST